MQAVIKVAWILVVTLSPQEEQRASKGPLFAVE